MTANFCYFLVVVVVVVLLVGYVYVSLLLVLIVCVLLIYDHLILYIQVGWIESSHQSWTLNVFKHRSHFLLLILWDVMPKKTDEVRQSRLYDKPSLSFFLWCSIIRTYTGYWTIQSLSVSLKFFFIRIHFTSCTLPLLITNSHNLSSFFFPFSSESVSPPPLYAKNMAHQVSERLGASSTTEARESSPNKWTYSVYSF